MAGVGARYWRQLLMSGAAVIAAASVGASFDMWRRADWQTLWMITAPLVGMWFALCVVVNYADVRGALMALMVTLPGWTIIGSDFIHAPFVSLIPYADLSGQIDKVFAITLGLVLLIPLAFWAWSGHKSSPAAYAVFIAAILAVFAVLFPYRYGASWYVLVMAESVLITAILRFDPRTEK